MLAALIWVTVIFVGTSEIALECDHCTGMSFVCFDCRLGILDQVYIVYQVLVRNLYVWIGALSLVSVSICQDCTEDR